MKRIIKSLKRYKYLELMTYSLLAAIEVCIIICDLDFKRT